MTAKQIPWLRVTAEGTVIVVSILLAFTIDAWWERLGDREEARAALVALGEDFRGYAEALDSARVHNEARVEDARLLLAATAPSPEPSDEEELHARLTALMSVRRVRLPPGILATLMESDGRSSIHDLHLRSALSEWTQSMELLNERNAFLERMTLSLHEYLDPRYPVRSGVNPLFEEVAPTPGQFPRELGPLLSDQQFENLILRRGVASAGVLRDIEILETTAQRILELLAEQLGPAQ